MPEEHPTRKTPSVAELRGAEPPNKLPSVSLNAGTPSGRRCGRPPSDAPSPPERRDSISIVQVAGQAELSTSAPSTVTRSRASEVVVLGLRCSWCPGNAPMPVLTGLNAVPPAARWSKNMPIEFLHGRPLSPEDIEMIRGFTSDNASSRPPWFACGTPCGPVSSTSAS
jgi:hypothetical protein